MGKLVKLITLFSTLFLTACGLFEYHPNEIRFDESQRNLNAKAFEEISATDGGKDTVRFILMGDTQRFYDQLEDFVLSANQQENIDFTAIAGDITDFGLGKEFIWINDILTRLDKPYFAVVGNHDLTGNGSRAFREMFGPLDDSFVFRNKQFVMVNTNSREYGFEGMVPDLNWLEERLSLTEVDQSIVISHVAPFTGDFDRELEIPYAQTLSESNKVRLSLHGHSHNFRSVSPYEDDVQYIVTSTVGKRQYLVFTVWRDDYSFEQVEF